MEMIKQFFNDESGATMVEYAIMVALIAVVSIVMIGYLGIVVNEKFDAVCTALNTTC